MAVHAIGRSANPRDLRRYAVEECAHCAYRASARPRRLRRKLTRGATANRASQIHRSSTSSSIRHRSHRGVAARKQRAKLRPRYGSDKARQRIGETHFAANSRSIFSAFARSPGCSSTNPPAARTFSNILSFSTATLHVSHQAQRDALVLRLPPLPQYRNLPQPKQATSVNQDCKNVSNSSRNFCRLSAGNDFAVASIIARSAR